MLQNARSTAFAVSEVILPPPPPPRLRLKTLLLMTLFVKREELTFSGKKCAKYHEDAK